MKENHIKPLLASSLISVTLLFSGCGSSSDSDTTTTSTNLISGQLVDNYIGNVDYKCADGTIGLTDKNGSFECPTFPITFSLAGLQLGKITTLQNDKQVFPQDLLQLSRSDINNSDVTAMAQFLQSSDDDNNTQNGIQIKASIKNTFQNTQLTFNASDLDYYATEANITLISANDATKHLQQTLTFVDDVDNANVPLNIKDALLTPQSTLSQETKDTLSYMGNEERLAHDIYLELYNYHMTNYNVDIQQLYTIPTKSETTHIETVQALINKYDLNSSSFTNINLPELGYQDTNVSEMTMGTYDIKAIQDLHDALLAKGEQSTQDALEVGCMVEVTDITDLLTDIQTAQDSNASDVVTAFEFLRDGSYSHYWSFDQGLKDIGVSDGCCVLGEEYCHPEYPTDTKGADASSNKYHKNF
jgi:hypothetical protein